MRHTSRGAQASSVAERGFTEGSATESVAYIPKALRCQKRVTLVVDNATLAFTLRNRVTSSVIAMNILDENWELLSFINDVVLMVSEDNPADCPSRRCLNDLDVRIKRMRLSMEAYAQGWQWASQKAPDWIGQWSAGWSPCRAKR